MFVKNEGCLLPHVVLNGTDYIQYMRTVLEDEKDTQHLGNHLNLQLGKSVHWTQSGRIIWYWRSCLVIVLTYRWVQFSLTTCENTVFASAVFCSSSLLLPQDWSQILKTIEEEIHIRLNSERSPADSCTTDLNHRLCEASRVFTKTANINEPQLILFAIKCSWIRADARLFWRVFSAVGWMLAEEY